MKNKLFILLISLLALACEEKILSPVTEGGTVPGVLTIDSVVNLNGAAQVFYTLPDNADLLYAVAKYQTPGGAFEKKVSIYSSNVLLEGFFEPKAYEVSFEGVNRAGTHGEAVSVTVEPLEAPANLLMKSMDIIAAFGGAYYEWKNSASAPLTVNILFEDSTGAMKPYEWVETDAPKQAYSVRGLDTTSRRFGAYITDRFFNSTDTLIKTLVPYFEQVLDVDGVNAVKLPGDADEESWSAGIASLFDDRYEWDHSVAFTTPSDGRKPTFTFDLQEAKKISRIWLKNRPEHIYSEGSIQAVKIYGLNELPEGDEAIKDLSNWEEIGTYEFLPPSGNPITSPTDGDKAYFDAGFDLGFPISAPKYRYIRFELLKTYGNTSYWFFTELKFYGSNA